jgi:Rad3-related DNA helicase
VPLAGQLLPRHSGAGRTGMLALAVPANSFPFRTYRQGQREAIDAAVAAFESGKRFVVIEAPTGSGKSALAVTLARHSHSAYIVTAQKILQDQYVRDFPDLALMKGRSNYPCLIAPTHAAAAPCIAGRKLPECERCPYFNAKDEAMAANTATMNYAYYLAELNYAGGFGDRRLLVLDEAHNAEGALMNFVQVTLSDTKLALSGITERIPSVLDELEYFDFVADLLPELTARATLIESQLRTEPTGSEMSVTLLRNKQWLDSSARRLRHLLASHDDGAADWVVEQQRTRDGQTLTFKPVRVDTFAEELLFSHADRVLLLSATILDGPTYLRGLGIDPADAEIISVESTFPPQNRPLVLQPVARLTRHHLDRDLPKLTEAVARLMEQHPHDKGVIHAHSYRIAAHLARNLPGRARERLVTHHDSSGRDAALAQHCSSPEPTVLLTPSMTEGIDLAEDLSRWQVICKIPYPFLGDRQIRTRTEQDPAWYEWRTCLTVVQAYGRSVRSETDYAVTYLLDADFPAFIRRQRQRLPLWFLEAISDERPD